MSCGILYSILLAFLTAQDPREVFKKSSSFLYNFIQLTNQKLKQQNKTITGCLKKRPVSRKMAITPLWKVLGEKVGQVFKNWQTN